MFRWIEAAVIAAVLGGLVTFHYVQVHQAKEEVKQYYEQIIKDADEAAKAKTILLASQSKALERIKDEQIKTLNARTNNLLMQLQHRPNRPEVVTVTEHTSSCTGGELYREDGEFLAREAARAERILTERNYYWEQYEEARKLINGKNVSTREVH